MERNPWGRGTSYQSLFGVQNMFRKIPFLVIYHLGNCDFSVIPKIEVDNLCKPIHDVITVPVSSDPLNLEAVERKEKELQKTEYLQNGKSILDQIKAIFHYF